MNDPAPAPANAPSLPPLDPDAVFAALSDPTRRRNLARLFDRQPLPLEAMGGTDRMHRDTIRKQLDVLVKSGLVIATTHPGHGRRLVYSLAPAVKTETTEQGRTMDYGCCLVRL